MKKLLAFSLCFTVCFLGLNAKASNLDSFLLDNSAQINALIPESLSSTDNSFLLARTNFLPDYQAKLGGRIAEGGKMRGSDDDVHNQRCAAYNKLGSCPSHSVGKGRKVYPGGLVCYDECVCDLSYYIYNGSKCAAPKELGGESCTVTTTNSKFSWLASSEVYFSKCSCPNEYRFTQDLYNTYVTKGTATCSSCTDDNGIHYKCSCPAEYKFSSSTLANGTCSAPCSVTLARAPEEYYRYACTCNTGYVMNAAGTACEKDCTGYNNTSCPEGANCEQCTAGGVKKYKITSCKETEGWEVGSTYRLTGEIATCKAKKCPTDFSTNTTGCSVDGYTLTTNGKSGGKPCGKCVCGNLNTSCTATNYPFSTPPANANYDTCSTGCGSEKVTRYKLTSCKNSYKLNDTGTACVEQTCQEIQSYYSTSVKEHRTCQSDIYHGGKTVCYHACRCDAGYFPNQYYLCEHCYPGTYNPTDISVSPTRTACDPCPVGKYQSGYAGTKCEACPIGMYQDKTGQTGCKNCDPGTFQDKTGQNECKKCDKGYYQDETKQSSCKICPAGTYQDKERQSSCIECPVDTYLDETGKTSQSDCKKCPSGTTEGKKGQTSVSACVTKTCSSYKSSYKASIPAAQVCKTVPSSEVGGLTCYKDCVNKYELYEHTMTDVLKCIVDPDTKKKLRCPLINIDSSYNKVSQCYQWDDTNSPTNGGTQTCGEKILDGTKPILRCGTRILGNSQNSTLHGLDKGDGWGKVTSYIDINFTGGPYDQGCTATGDRATYKVDMQFGCKYIYRDGSLDSSGNYVEKKVVLLLHPNITYAVDPALLAQQTNYAAKCEAQKANTPETSFKNSRNKDQIQKNIDIKSELSVKNWFAQ